MGPCTTESAARWVVPWEKDITPPKNRRALQLIRRLKSSPLEKRCCMHRNLVKVSQKNRPTSTCVFLFAR